MFRYVRALAVKCFAIEILLFLLLTFESVSGQNSSEECVQSGGIVNHDQSSCYFIRQRSVNFDDAQLYCEQTFAGGSLPILTTVTDEQILLSAMNYVPFFWVGVKAQLFLEPDSYRVYFVNHWIDGRSRNLSKWDLDTPLEEDIVNGSVICAEASLLLDEESISWTARDCNNSLSANTVCERKLPSQSQSKPTDSVTQMSTGEDATTLSWSTPVEKIHQAHSNWTTTTTETPTLDSNLSSSENEATTFERLLALFNYAYQYSYLLRILFYLVLGLLAVQLLTALYICVTRRRSLMARRSQKQQQQDQHSHRRPSATTAEESSFSILYINEEASVKQPIPPNTFVVRM